MREQEKLKKIKVLLIGDTHPEMIAIAKNLALNSIDFKIVLPTYFTVRESRILSNLGVRILGLGAWLQKRTLDSHINSDSIIRKYAFMETSTWLFKRMGYHRLSWKLADMYNKKLASQLPKIIESTGPSIVVSYDTIRVPKLVKIKHIVICPMSHPVTVKESLNESKILFPDWPEMEDEKPLGLNETADFADRVVLLSRFAKNSYISQGFNASKLEVIHIGPINNNISHLPPLESNNSLLKILFLGRMTRIKGVEALAKLSHSLNPLKFQINLVGQCSPEIASYIRGISNSNVLKLIENPTPNEISMYFEDSNVFALPSFNEGFNISSLEAMSYGLVPILSKNAGVAEVLENTPLARLIIDPGSVEQLKFCLNYLSDLEQGDFQDLARFSFELSRGFSFDRFAEEFLEVLMHEIER